MGNAEPMDVNQHVDGYSPRLAGYVNQRKPGYTRSMHVVTPRQWRRYWHKANRLDGGEPVDVSAPVAEWPKGHSTARRADAISGRLAGRRFLEARRG